MKQQHKQNFILTNFREGWQCTCTETCSISLQTAQLNELYHKGLVEKGLFLYVNSELCNAGKCILMFQQVSVMAELTKHEIYLSNLRAVFCDQSGNQFVCADSQFHTLCERTWRFTPASGVLKRNTFT